jgi:16S rRNA (guanine527-N7)-methyltransferase
MQSILKIFSDEFGVSRETLTKLQEYVNLLTKWNKVINLVSSNDIEDIWQKHILISAELMLHIPNKDIKIIDLGSGSGIPGMVLSIMGIKEMVLVESNSKKAAFLLQASQISDYKVRVINDRIEKQQLECDIITSRALASTEKLISFTKHVHFNDSMILIKGADIEDETSGLDGYELEQITSRYSDNTTIVKIKKTNV